MCGILCCAASSLCSAGNCCGNSKMGARAGRVMYTILYFFAGLIALLLKYFGHYLFVDFIIQIGCVENTTDTDPSGSSYYAPCAGAQAVYRIALGMVSFYISCGFISSILTAFHSGWWIIKVFLYIAALIYPFFLPGDSMETFAEASRYFAGAFLVFQMLTFIAFAYNMHEGIMEKSEAFTEHQSRVGTDSQRCNCINCWTVLYLVLCIGGIGGIITGLILMYTNFPCFLPSFMTSVSLVIALGVILLCLWSKFAKGLLTGVVVACYSTYLCWSALTSNPDFTEFEVDGVNKTCNPFVCDPTDPDTKCDAGTMVVGILFTIVAVSYTGYSLGDSTATEDEKDRLKKKRSKSQEKFEPLSADIEKDGSVNKQALADHEEQLRDEAEEDHGPVGDDDDASFCCGCGMNDHVRNALFHLVMSLASFYLAMLLTNWAVLDVSNAAGVGTASMWIKFVSQWLTVVLFLWTLLAPLCCKDREFD